MFRKVDFRNDKPDYSSVAPPANLNDKNKRVANETNSRPGISGTSFDTSLFGRHKKSLKSEEDYFNDDDDEEANNAEYASGNQDEDEDEEDPLDAFMADIEKEVENKKKPSVKVDATVPMSTKKVKDIKCLKGVRDDIELEDTEESYYRYMEENPEAGIGTLAAGDSEDEEGDGELIEYDEDGNPIVPKSSKYIDPLPKIDHSEITYEPFVKNFYHESEDIKSLNSNEVIELRKRLGVKVLGLNAPKPVTSFAHFGFDEQLMKIIRKLEYTKPSPIQAQGVPIVLSGRDLIGIAKTGSGKTAAYIWPMLIHIMDQRELKFGDGPIGLILAPTRELAQQIYTEAKKFGKAYGISVICAYGGSNKFELSKDMEAGAEIVVATPGRMIDMIKAKATNLLRVTMLVLDEADRMFDMGFEPQVRSICDHVRPDRQTLMFSATFKRKVEKVSRDVLQDPIKVIQGEIGEANEDIEQIIKVINEPTYKWEWLITNLVKFTSTGSVLIFVTRKANAEELANNLRVKDFDCLLIHGDMEQAERNKVITAFKRKEKNILVATDVAARGLDISHIRTVVNYDVARDIDTHTHRIGRTGRAGEKGTAYTLVVPERDKEFAGHLVRNLEGANQQVPNQLLDLAMQSAWFKKSRFKENKAKKLNVGGAGLGFKSRPGFGSKDSSGNSSSASYTKDIESKLSIKESSSSGNKRLDAMKAAFAAQYHSTFKHASDVYASTIKTPSSESNQTNSEKPRKRSRWDK